MATLAFMFTHPAVEDIGINVMAYGQRSQRYATSQILRHQFCFELRTVTPAPANLLGIVLCHYKHPLIISWVLSLAYFDGAEKMPSPDAYNFRPFNPEKEIQVGLFRVPIPKVDMSAFREAVANALVHRDYHRLGAVHIRLDDYGLTLSNPGGLVEGVTLNNLLTTEPRPRNPLLADAMKRIGVVERSGRGVDKIYRGMLRFGRPEPDYSDTNLHSVVVRLATVEADEAFLRLVIEQEKQRNGLLPMDSLIVLAALREQKRLGAEELAQSIQRNLARTKSTLEQLVEAGLVDAHGTSRSRTYTLSAAVYRESGEEIAYTRQAGFTDLQHEQMVLAHVNHHGRIQRSQVMELCRLNRGQAYRLLSKLKEEGKLEQQGEKRGAYYTLGAAAKVV